MSILVIDDIRILKPNPMGEDQVTYARNLHEARDQLFSLRAWDQVWLDNDLGEGEEVLTLLKDLERAWEEDGFMYDVCTMSVRDSFASWFGEDQAVAVEAAAEGHRGDLLEGDKHGSDAFRDCIVICIGFECMSSDHYREWHGITTPWEEIKGWIKLEGKLPEHDGVIDYISLLAGAYNEFMPLEAEA